MDFDYYCRDWKRKNLVNIDVLFIPHRNRLVNMCGKYVLFKALGGGYNQPTYQQLPYFSITYLICLPPFRHNACLPYRYSMLTLNFIKIVIVSTNVVSGYIL
jgi:hypothetical protein